MTFYGKNTNLYRLYQLMDAISLIALISTIFGKKASGFLYVGFGFYFLAALVAFTSDKNLMPVFFGLMILHFAVNLPLKWLNRPS